MQDWNSSVTLFQLQTCLVFCCLVSFCWTSANGMVLSCVSAPALPFIIFHLFTLNSLWIATTKRSNHCPAEWHVLHPSHVLNLIHHLTAMNSSAKATITVILASSHAWAATKDGCVHWIKISVFFVFFVISLCFQLTEVNCRLGPYFLFVWSNSLGLFQMQWTQRRKGKRERKRGGVEN